eukprot:3120391-Alexandrium_andersonii.AAC.1
MITGMRHICGIVRKAAVCRCGCRGWCTFWPLLRFLRWSFEALAAGTYPHTRHDGKPLQGSRGEKAGQQLRSKAAVLYCKGDWAEFCERFGFPSHGSGLRPCFCCTAAGNAQGTTNKAANKVALVPSLRGLGPCQTVCLRIRQAVREVRLQGLPDPCDKARCYFVSTSTTPQGGAFWRR